MRRMDLRKKRNKSERIRMNLTLDKDLEHNLKRLSISCDMPASSLAYLLLKMSLNNEGIIEYFEKRYNQDPRDKVTIIKHNGGIHLS